MLQSLLKTAAVRMGRRHLMNPVVVQRFVQSNFQQEMVRGLIKQFRRGNWDRGMIVCNNINHLTNPDPATNIKENQAFKNQEEKHLQKLGNTLFAAVPYENKIKPKVFSKFKFN